MVELDLVGSGARRHSALYAVAICSAQDLRIELGSLGHE